MTTTIVLILAALALSGCSVYYFFKANYCVCNKQHRCSSPVEQYWLFALLNALTALLCSCLAMHSEKGTFLWLILMTSCFLGAFMSAKIQKLKQCQQTKLLSKVSIKEMG